MEKERGEGGERDVHSCVNRSSRPRVVAKGCAGGLRMGKPKVVRSYDSRNMLTDRHLCSSCVVRGCIRAWRKRG